MTNREAHCRYQQGYTQTRSLSLVEAYERLFALGIVPDVDVNYTNYEAYQLWKRGYMDGDDNAELNFAIGYQKWLNDGNGELPHFIMTATGDLSFEAPSLTDWNFTLVSDELVYDGDNALTRSGDSILWQY